MTYSAISSVVDADYSPAAAAAVAAVAAVEIALAYSRAGYSNNWSGYA